MIGQRGSVFPPAIKKYYGIWNLFIMFIGKIYNFSFFFFLLDTAGVKLIITGIGNYQDYLMSTVTHQLRGGLVS